MIKRLALIISLLVPLLAVTPTYAFDFFGPACNGDTGHAAACTDNSGTDPLTGSDGLIVKIADIITYIAGGAAIIIIVISGIRFITSGGDTEKVRAARNTLTGALIGVAVIVLARALIVYVINQLN